MEMFLVVTAGRGGGSGGDTGIWGAEARGAAKHHSMPRTSPHDKELSLSIIL